MTLLLDNMAKKEVNNYAFFLKLKGKSFETRFKMCNAKSKINAVKFSSQKSRTLFTKHINEIY